MNTTFSCRFFFSHQEYSLQSNKAVKNSIVTVVVSWTSSTDDEALYHGYVQEIKEWSNLINQSVVLNYLRRSEEAGSAECAILVPQHI